MAQVGTSEAAEQLEITQERVTQLIRTGDLKAQKIGRTWVIYQSSIDAYKRRRRGPGRPAKDKP